MTLWRVWNVQEEKGEESQEEEEEEGSSKGPDYDYLLGMTMWSLTQEKKDELLRKRDEKQTELRILQAKTAKDLWQEDLLVLSEKVTFQQWISIREVRNCTS